MSKVTGDRPGQRLIVSRVAESGELVEVWRHEYDSHPIDIHDARMSGDMWLRVTFAVFGDEWDGPGAYRLVVENRYEHAVLLDMTWSLPVAPVWAALDDAGRRFGFTVLSAYPGTTPALVGEHLSVFGDHYNARISTEELTALTGYRLPVGASRPSGPRVSAEQLAAHP